MSNGWLTIDTGANRFDLSPLLVRLLRFSCRVFWVLWQRERKGRNEVDRGRCTWSGNNVTITEIGCRTNRTWKYSNGAQKYPRWERHISVQKNCLYTSELHEKGTSLIFIGHLSCRILVTDQFVAWQLVAFNSSHDNWSRSIRRSFCMLSTEVMGNLILRQIQMLILFISL